jgi:hypothetical protein
VRQLGHGAADEALGVRARVLGDEGDDLFEVPSRGLRPDDPEVRRPCVARIVASTTPTVLEERTRLAHLLGDKPGCERKLRDAQRLFAEIGTTGHAERLAKGLVQT